MGKIDRGRIPLSTNFILTASLLTRILTFGFVVMSIYIKVGDEILDENVMKMMNILKVLNGRPLGSTVQSIVFSLIAVFVLELVTGIFAFVGAVGKKEHCLVVAVLMSSLMMIVYTVYIILISLLYQKTDDINSTLLQYAKAYEANRLSDAYRQTVYPNFIIALGCGWSYSEYSTCSNVYKEQVRTYFQTYIGICVICFLCHAVLIIAVEYTYRKLEFKRHPSRLSATDYFLLLTLRYGIGKSFVYYVCDIWKMSKLKVLSILFRCVSLLLYLGLLVVGLTLCGDEFIINNTLKDIFHQLRFYQYTFYDILVGLSASCVVIGVVGAVTSVIILLLSWRQSKRLLLVGGIFSTVLVILQIIAFIFGAVFIDEIKDEMKNQLRIQQAGYYINYYANKISILWNTMFMTLECCGVDDMYDTNNANHDGHMFCCENSHESRLTPSGYSNPYIFLEHFGGCGRFRTDTCSEKIISNTGKYFERFITIVIILIVLEIVCVLLVNYKEYFDTKYTSGDSGNGEWKCSRICPLTICRGTATVIESYFKGSKVRIVYLVSVGFIMIFSFTTLCIAVHIRYDTVFGNNNIKELLTRISIKDTDTNLNKAIENFSTVVSTFSVVAICIVVYSLLIQVPEQTKTVLWKMGLGFWIATVMSHIIEMSVLAKYITEVGSSVTDQLGSDIKAYRYSHRSEDRDIFSFYWNTLFVKGKYDILCTNTPQSYHTQGCDTIIDERLNDKYITPFYVLTSLIVFFEILCITTIIISLIKKDNYVNSHDNPVIDTSQVVIERITESRIATIENDLTNNPGTSGVNNQTEKRTSLDTIKTADIKDNLAMTKLETEQSSIDNNVSHVNTGHEATQSSEDRIEGSEIITTEI